LEEEHHVELADGGVIAIVRHATVVPVGKDSNLLLLAISVCALEVDLLRNLSADRVQIALHIALATAQRQCDVLDWVANGATEVDTILVTRSTLVLLVVLRRSAIVIGADRVEVALERRTHRHTAHHHQHQRGDC